MTVAAGRGFSFEDQAIALIGDKRVHFKGTSGRKSDGRCPFNINRTVLTADYELWVCGISGKDFYLVPIAKLQWMNSHTEARPDYRNDGYTVVDIDVGRHRAIVAAGVEVDLAPYWRATL